jgi:hypothetical protein
MFILSVLSVQQGEISEQQANNLGASERCRKVSL